MVPFATPVQWILGLILVLSSLGVITARKPIYSSLSFLLTLLTLAALYLQLSAEFISVMQILVYAGAILVIFMFIIILFQDAHEQIEKYEAKSSVVLLLGALVIFLAMLPFLSWHLRDLPLARAAVSDGFGTVESLGKALYLDFFFPFEAIVMLFLVAIVGALYIGKKEAR